MGKKRYIVIALVTLLLAVVKPASTCAQATISSPQIHCLAVDSAGDVTVTWTIPADTNLTFISYEIYKSVTLTGPYTLKATVTTKTQNTVTINALGANAAPIYFYIVTNTTGGTSTQIDTLVTIFLNISNPGGMAILKWNPMHTPNLPTFNGWYKIYREYPQYVWKVIDSVQALSDTDIIYICSAFISYKIVTDDASGCQSVSNIASSNFKNTNVPAIISLDTTSVSPASTVNISWTACTTPDVIGYIIYAYIGGIWQPVDTVWGRLSTFYNYTGGSPGSGSVSIEIAAIDSCNNTGNKSNAQHTIYLTETPDKCAHENKLSWNAYVNLLPAIQTYEVYASVNGSKYTIIGTTDTTNFTDSNLNTPQTICYFVRVVSTNGVTATSNVICYTITLPPPPKFAYLNDATVNNIINKVQVDGYMDLGDGVADYIFQRAPLPTGKYATIATIPAPASNFISYIDPSADPTVESYTYRIILEDSCQYLIDTTNIGQTMFLSAAGSNTGIDSVSWNDYQWWKGNVVKYNIYRNEDGGPFAPVGTVNYSAAGTNVFVDNVSSIITGQGIFGYYIEAVEGNNGYGFVDTSYSNIAYAYQDPRVYVPNAFNPRGVNRIFIPIGVFVNLASYDFTIYDRWGQLLFETNDPTVGWDGYYHGREAIEDVYIYRVQYTSSKGEYFDKKGSVLLLK